MSLRGLNLKQSYSSDEDNILFDFYIPSLKEAVRYERLAGYFSSSTLAIAARGIIDLIKNDGYMRIVACPALSKKDIHIIESAKSNPEDYISDLFVKEIETLQEGFLYDHLKALGWMIANKKLYIKIAFVTDDIGNLLDIDQIEETGLFHQKVGILFDENEDSISFSGSINESASGWLTNIEEFKVFRSWVDAENEYLKTDKDKFIRIWNENSNRIRVIDAPQAIINKLISIKPENLDAIDWNKHLKSYSNSKRKKIELFDHQNNAISRWIDKGKCGIFEMATGTGKTLTALGCIEKSFKSEDKSLTIIACPQKHLLRQWEKEVYEFGVTYDRMIIADGDNPKYKKQMAETLIDTNLGHFKNIIVLTTHRTLASKDFITIIKKQKKDIIILLIADEVHGLGSSENKKALTDFYKYRLGLSATPKRWYDESGTDYLYEYFNGVAYEFGLDQALSTINPMTGKTYLTPYRYVPKHISLSEEELEDYIRLTHTIIRNLSSNSSIGDDFIEMFIYKRANIVKNAEQKYSILKEIINEISPVCSTIIFCSPQQIDYVMSTVNQFGINVHRFTEKEGTKPEEKYGFISQREYLVNEFSEGTYQVLVAMKCLDEGVDVPNAKNAILMASSTNPREYIQRIGRVIRRSADKTEAKIFDLIVAPSIHDLPPELKEIERRILSKELTRAEEIARNAINNAAALEILHNIKSNYI